MRRRLITHWERASQFARLAAEVEILPAALPGATELGRKHGSRVFFGGHGQDLRVV
jgi:hypothetical protein